jgi:hypothetical protein
MRRANPQFFLDQQEVNWLFRRQILGEPLLFPCNILRSQRNNMQDRIFHNQVRQFDDGQSANSGHREVLR